MRGPTLAGAWRPVSIRYAVDWATAATHASTLPSPDAKRIYLVVDNWPVHHHPDATVPVGQDSRVTVLWLPTCSPLLNPTEKVRKWARQHLSHMHSRAEGMDGFGEHLVAALANAGEDSEALLRYTATGKSKLHN